MNPTQLGSFESIPLAAIRPAATNPRKYFDPIALEELTRSISEMGVTNPLLLRHLLTPTHDPKSLAPVLFEIVSGERRYRAAKAAGLEGVPAIVKEISDADALDLQMIENLQRADLHPMEEAEGYRVLESHGATAEDIARRTGKTLSQVVQTMRLLSLELFAKQIFADGHLTLGHARLLARLTPEQQERALLYLLGIRDWQVNKDRTAADAIRERSAQWQPPVIEPGDEEDGSADWKRSEYERKRKSHMVEVTEAALKDWISSHVLLQLANVPWHLEDGTLVPAAGPCTTCPKRTGANIALFQDLTTAEDTCTDPACFATKQTAQLNRQKDAAKASGAPLLKISAKRSNEKLEEPAVQVKKGATTVTRQTVKEGQWVASEEGACGGTVQALVQDGPDKGKLLWVCADQKCKVHKHTVASPNTGYSNQRSQAQQKEAEAKKLDDYLCELKIRAAFLQEAREDITINVETLREAILFILDGNRGLEDTFPVIAKAYGLELPDLGPEDVWEWRGACKKLLFDKVATIRSITELYMLLIDLRLGRMVEPDYWGRNNRESAVKAIAEYGVDTAAANAIVDRITAEHNAPKLVLEAESASVDAKGGKKKLTADQQAKRKAAAAKQFPTPTKKTAAKKAAKAGAR